VRRAGRPDRGSRASHQRPLVTPGRPVHACSKKRGGRHEESCTRSVASRDYKGWSLYGAERSQPAHSVVKRIQRKRLKQAETVAAGCDQLPIGAHGKKGVGGSTPSEASTCESAREFLDELPMIAARGATTFWSTDWSTASSPRPALRRSSLQRRCRATSAFCKLQQRAATRPAALLSLSRAEGQVIPFAPGSAARNARDTLWI
jgi:hypothetical protein